VKTEAAMKKSQQADESFQVRLLDWHTSDAVLSTYFSV